MHACMIVLTLMVSGGFDGVDGRHGCQKLQRMPPRAIKAGNTSRMLQWWKQMVDTSKHSFVKFDAVISSVHSVCVIVADFTQFFSLKTALLLIKIVNFHNFCSIQPYAKSSSPIDLKF